MLAALVVSFYVEVRHPRLSDGFRIMAPSYGDALFIEKILAMKSVESSEIGGPTGYDLVRRNAGLQLPDGFGVADEKQQLFGIKLVGIQPLQNGRDLQSHPHHAHCLTIGDAHANSAAA